MAQRTRCHKPTPHGAHGQVGSGDPLLQGDPIVAAFSSSRRKEVQLRRNNRDNGKGSKEGGDCGWAGSEDSVVRAGVLEEMRAATSGALMLSTIQLIPPSPQNFVAAVGQIEN